MTTPEFCSLLLMVGCHRFGPQGKLAVLLKRAAALARPLACPPAVIAGARRSEPALEKGNFPSGADARVQLGFKRVRDLNEAESIQCQQSLLKKQRLCRTDNRKWSGRFQIRTSTVFENGECFF